MSADIPICPRGLQNLIEESFTLHDRISKLDRVLAKPSAAEAPQPAVNPVAHQVGLLQRAFSAKVS